MLEESDVVHQVQGRLVHSGSRVAGSQEPDSGAVMRVDYFFVGENKHNYHVLSNTVNFQTLF